VIVNSFLLFEVYYEARLERPLQVNKRIQDDAQKTGQRLVRRGQPGPPQAHRPLLRHQDRTPLLKQIDLASIPSEVEVKLVEREVKLHSTVHHPHIVTLWDTISEDGNMFIILEYAEQGNLFYYQNTKQVFTEPEAALFFAQTVRAMDHLHSLDIMHRDLKVTSQFNAA